MRRVDPNVYTKEYYLNDCTGFEEFKESFGNNLEIRFKELIKYFKIAPNSKILDIGCGRGEMVFYAARTSSEAYGIDYSKDSIKLSNLARNKQSERIKKKTKFILMDAKKLKFSNDYFDLIILTDVVEHLYPEELEIVFREIKRVLKNQGKLVIHTAPNKIFNDIAYKYYCYPLATLLVSVWNLIMNKKYPNIENPKKIRTDSHAIMHINEPTYFSLRKLIKKYKYEGRIISTNVTVKKQVMGVKDNIFNFLVFLHPISKYFPINVLFGSDFVGVLINKK